MYSPDSYQWLTTIRPYRPPLPCALPVSRLQLKILGPVTTALALPGLFPLKLLLPLLPPRLLLPRLDQPQRVLVAALLRLRPLLAGLDQPPGLGLVAARYNSQAASRWGGVMAAHIAR